MAVAGRTIITMIIVEWNIIPITFKVDHYFKVFTLVANFTIKHPRMLKIDFNNSNPSIKINTYQFLAILIGELI